MKPVPSRGLPPRIYLPIVAVAALVLLAVVGYFLHVALSVSGSAIGPGDSTPARGIAPTPGVK